MSLTEKVTEFFQHRSVKRLSKREVKVHADNPDVVFHERAPSGEDAPHGVNTPTEMSQTDAEPVTD